MLQFKLIIPIIMLFAIISSLAAAKYYHLKSVNLAKDVEVVKQENNEIINKMKTQSETIKKYDEMSKAQETEKNISQDESNERIVYINKFIKSDNCSNQPVPVDVVNKLREHARKVSDITANTSSN